MMNSEQIARATAKTEAGFSLIELSVSLIVMMIIAAIAIPSILQGWNSYRLTSAADSVAGLLERTRFEAIHKNARLSCVAAQVGGLWVVAIDENGNGQPDPTEPQVDLPGPATFVGAGVAPGPASMGPSYAAAIIPNGSLTFDARGTVVAGAGPGGAVPFVLYFGIPNQPTYGYRAVTITLMGQVKVWQAAGGGWVTQ